jgi:hypothetical protein
VTAHEQHPVWRIWTAAGSPTPYEVDGTTIDPRPTTGVCAVTGGPARYTYKDGLSQSFTLARSANKAFRFAHLTPAGEPLALSAAAVWAAKAIALRSAPWIVEPTRAGDKITFHCSQSCPADERSAGWKAVWGKQKPSGFLPWLLRNRPAGTIAGLPLYGIAHGGEVHLSRCAWPRAMPGHHDGPSARPAGFIFKPKDPLVKLQAKHTAIYAPASTRAGLLALQVDSDAVMEVEVARWRAAIDPAIAYMDRLMTAGLTEYAARQVLITGAADIRHPSRIHAIAAAMPAHIPPSLTREPFWAVFAGALYV